jgi:hypothetical protein
MVCDRGGVMMACSVTVVCVVTQLVGLVMWRGEVRGLWARHKAVPAGAVWLFGVAAEESEAWPRGAAAARWCSGCGCVDVDRGVCACVLRVRVPSLHVPGDTS